MISFRTDWFDLLAVQGILKSLLQHHSSKVSILRKDEKFLHHEGHPERFIALHGEVKREEGVRGDPNEMRWN